MLSDGCSALYGVNPNLKKNWSTIKKKAHQDVSSGCLVLDDARQFADEVILRCDIQGRFIFKYLLPM